MSSNRWLNASQKFSSQSKNGEVAIYQNIESTISAGHYRLLINSWAFFTEKSHRRTSESWYGLVWYFMASINRRLTRIRNMAYFGWPLISKSSSRPIQIQSTGLAFNSSRFSYVPVQFRYESYVRCETIISLTQMVIVRYVRLCCNRNYT